PATCRSRALPRRRDTVRFSALILLGVTAWLLVASRASETAAQPARQSRPAEADYATVGVTPFNPLVEIRFVCNLVTPADLAVRPGNGRSTRAPALPGVCI